MHSRSSGAAEYQKDMFVLLGLARPAGWLFQVTLGTCVPLSLTTSSNCGITPQYPQGLRYEKP